MPRSRRATQTDPVEVLSAPEPERDPDPWAGLAPPREYLHEHEYTAAMYKEKYNMVSVAAATHYLDKLHKQGRVTRDWVRPPGSLRPCYAYRPKV